MTAFKDWLNGLTSKTTPVDADELYVRDSSGTPGSKKLTWANLVATLKTAFNSLTLTGGTATASSPVLTTTQTWNNAGVTFVGKSNEFTDTASASDSLLERWQVGGVTKAGIGKMGQVCVGSGLNGYNLPFSGFSYDSGLVVHGETTFGYPDGYQMVIRTSRIGINKNAALGWMDMYSWGSEAVWVYDGSNTIAQRNSTNAQTYRTYGTYTDSSNYRRLTQTMSTAGVAEIKPEGAGTGASGNVLHISGLPTSNPGAGILWNDGGTVKVGT